MHRKVCCNIRKRVEQGSAVKLTEKIRTVCLQQGIYLTLLQTNSKVKEA